MAALSITSFAKYFSDEPKSLNRGENHYQSGHVLSFCYCDGIIRGSVQASMKSTTYKVTVSVKFLLLDVYPLTSPNQNLFKLSDFESSFKGNLEK